MQLCRQSSWRMWPRFEGVIVPGHVAGRAVDHDEARVDTPDKRRRGVQQAHLSLELRRQPLIIVVEKGEQLSPRRVTPVFRAADTFRFVRCFR